MAKTTAASKPTKAAAIARRDQTLAALRDLRGMHGSLTEWIDSLESAVRDEDCDLEPDLAQLGFLTLEIARATLAVQYAARGLANA